MISYQLMPLKEVLIRPHVTSSGYSTYDYYYSDYYLHSILLNIDFEI